MPTQPPRKPIFPGGIVGPSISTVAVGGPPSQVSADVEKKTSETLITAVEKIRGTRVIVLWITMAGKMSQGVTESLYDQLRAVGKVEALDLVLFTMGGDAEAPWSIVGLIREFCDRFSVLIPFRAFSAGTALALGANEIVMTPLSVLGPIDPSRTHPLLPRHRDDAEPQPISVQDMRHAMQFIRSVAPEGAGYTPEAWAQIFASLFDKIHPLAIGAIEQTYELAKLVAKQCLGTHMDPVADEPKINHIVDRLCDGYKSHAYPINRREARQLGLPVIEAPVDLDNALFALSKFYSGRPIVRSGPFPPAAQQDTTLHVAWLDSTALHCVAELVQRGGQNNTVQAVRDVWVAY